MKVAAPTPGRVTSRGRSLLAALPLMFGALAHAETNSASTLAEQRAKAVTQVVLGILSYARWPVEPEQLRLCLVGPTEYADDLVKGTTQASGRPVAVRRLLANDPRIVTECDAMYLGQLSQDERKQLFSAVTGHPVLSISEANDPCTVGSVFCLRVSDRQVAFDVNLDSVARSGVRIHPSVLQLSRRRAGQP
ncbi:YfiR family protein [Pseudomonas sp. GD03860]|uniref:YfiR family protein n=1 Tax=Pseudomonas TaxID=286 RepID=UPI00236435CF|nr:MULTISPECIES: YfiR family protein [Pseudomonas]MDD2060260.1 YfiR family protein [Pseudomonas putida]MDH0640017.1 YfiR family protein [Pseudomonas sp. GD03860]